MEVEGCLLQGRGVAHGDASAFPCLISLPARCSPSQPRSPSASCTPGPPKPTQARGKLLLLSAPGRREDLGPEAPGPAPKTQGPAPEASSEFLAGPSAEEDFSVDFEKIYKYLSSISRGGQGPELSPAGEKGGADDLGVGVSGGKPRPSLTRPLSIHHQSQLWSLTCSWHFLRSCPACPALPWLNICQICTYA